MKKSLDSSRRCITGAPTTEERCIGFCKSKNHMGYITAPILRRRQCLQKSCNCFVPLKEHPYWGRREQMISKENKKKEELKTIRNNEKTIPKQLNIPQEYFLLCKHLFENAYIIVCKQGLELETCYKYRDCIVYAFEISKKKEQNIGITYDLLLPPEIREKKLKNDLNKNRER